MQIEPGLFTSPKQQGHWSSTAGAFQEGATPDPQLCPQGQHTALHFLLLPSAFLCLEILGNSAFHFKHVAKRTSPNYYIWPCNKRFTLFLSNFIDTKMTYLKTLRVWRYLRFAFDMKSAIIAKRWVLLFPLFFNTTLACKILNFYDSPTRRRKLENNLKEQN